MLQLILRPDGTLIDPTTGNVYGWSNFVQKFHVNALPTTAILRHGNFTDSTGKSGTFAVMDLDNAGQPSGQWHAMTDAEVTAKYDLASQVVV